MTENRTYIRREHLDLIIVALDHYVECPAIEDTDQLYQDMEKLLADLKKI